jgi:hypothetical protein
VVLRPEAISLLDKMSRGRGRPFGEAARDEAVFRTAAPAASGKSESDQVGYRVVVGVRRPGNQETGDRCKAFIAAADRCDYNLEFDASASSICFQRKRPMGVERLLNTRRRYLVALPIRERRPSAVSCVPLGRGSLERPCVRRSFSFENPFLS